MKYSDCILSGGQYYLVGLKRKKQKQNVDLSLNYKMAFLEVSMAPLILIKNIDVSEIYNWVRKSS